MKRCSVQTSVRVRLGMWECLRGGGGGGRGRRRRRERGKERCRGEKEKVQRGWRWMKSPINNFKMFSFVVDPLRVKQATWKLANSQVEEVFQWCFSGSVSVDKQKSQQLRKASLYEILSLFVWGKVSCFDSYISQSSASPKTFHICLEIWSKIKLQIDCYLSTLHGAVRQQL